QPAVEHRLQRAAVGAGAAAEVLDELAVGGHALVLGAGQAALGAEVGVGHHEVALHGVVAHELQQEALAAAVAAGDDAERRGARLDVIEVLQQGGDLVLAADHDEVEAHPGGDAAVEALEQERADSLGDALVVAHWSPSWSACRTPAWCSSMMLGGFSYASMTLSAKVSSARSLIVSSNRSTGVPSSRATPSSASRGAPSATSASARFSPGPSSASSAWYSLASTPAVTVTSAGDSPPGVAAVASRASRSASAKMLGSMRRSRTLCESRSSCARRAASTRTCGLGFGGASRDSKVASIRSRSSLVQPCMLL